MVVTPFVHVVPPSGDHDRSRPDLLRLEASKQEVQVLEPNANQV